MEAFLSGRCIVVPAEFLWAARVFKASCRLRSIFPQMHVHRDEKTTTTKKPNRNQRPQYLISYSTNTRSCTQWKASFPIFWLVSQHCYDALLCIWAIIYLFIHLLFFFLFLDHVWMSKEVEKKTRRQTRTSPGFPHSRSSWARCVWPRRPSESRRSGAPLIRTFTLLLLLSSQLVGVFFSHCFTICFCFLS